MKKERRGASRKEKQRQSALRMRREASLLSLDESSTLSRAMPRALPSSGATTTASTLMSFPRRLHAAGHSKAQWPSVRRPNCLLPSNGRPLLRSCLALRSVAIFVHSNAASIPASVAVHVSLFAPLLCLYCVLSACVQDALSRARAECESVAPVGSELGVSELKHCGLATLDAAQDLISCLLDKPILGASKRQVAPAADGGAGGVGAGVGVSVGAGAGAGDGDVERRGAGDGDGYVERREEDGVDGGDGAAGDTQVPATPVWASRMEANFKASFDRLDDKITAVQVMGLFSPTL